MLNNSELKKTVVRSLTDRRKDRERRRGERFFKILGSDCLLSWYSTLFEAGMKKLNHRLKLPASYYWKHTNKVMFFGSHDRQNVKNRQAPLIVDPHRVLDQLQVNKKEWARRLKKVGHEQMLKRMEKRASIPFQKKNICLHLLRNSVLHTV